MPGFEVDRFNANHVNVLDNWFHPLAQQQASFRTNLAASVSPTFDLSANAGFIKVDNRIMPESDLIIALLYTGLQNYGYKGCPGGVKPCGLDKIPTQVDGTPLNDYLQWAPGDIMQNVNESDTQRMLGSFNANWRPLAWMQNEGTIGVDLNTTNFYHFCGLNQCPPQSASARVGNVNDNRNNNRNLSARLVSTSAWNAKSWMNLKTTFGADYVNLENDGINSSGQTLPPGATGVAAATSIGASETQPTATKTLGVYAQEQASFRDRLFLTVAARSDQNSAFGTNFQRVLYPKASLSWLVSDESFFPKYEWLNQLRLRTSYGVSGVQPGRTSGLVTFAAGVVAVDGRSSTTGSDLSSLSASNPGQREPQARAVGRRRARIRWPGVQQPGALRVHVLQKDHERRAHQRADRSVWCGIDHEHSAKTSARRGTPATRCSSTRSSSTRVASAGTSRSPARTTPRSSSTSASTRRPERLASSAPAV